MNVENNNVALWKDRKFLVTCMFMGLVFMTVIRVYWGNPPSTPDLQNIVIGFVLGQALPFILKYWFPSSDESEKKNETISELVSQAKKD